MATRPHFLLASIAAQGHINPARHLARRLARLSGARVTVAIPKDAYRRMFKPSSDENLQEEEEHIDSEAEGLVTYIPFSDGTERGLDGRTDMPEIEASVVASLTRAAEGLAARGRPVTCVIYALLLWMAAEAARNVGVPSVLYWIQPAAVFAIYHRYFGGGAARAVADHVDDPSFWVELPGLIPLQIRDLPSFLTNPSPSEEDDPYYFLFELFQSVFRLLGKEVASGSRPTVLVNSFQELEADVISSIDDVELLAVGPMVQSAAAAAASGHDLFEHDDRSHYMEWLGRREERSVVYVSFGSLSSLSKRQMEEIHAALRECKRPYLWVVRKDSDNREVVEGCDDVDDEEEEKEGMVVEWCDQVRVLSHRSVGCFVTHCGWNSTLESMVCGVPMVMLPQWTDQATNARLVEGGWGTGVRAVASEGGVVEGEEVKRCLDVVMGLRGGELRRNAEMWRDKARAAVEEGGSSVLNIRTFVERFSICSK